MSSWAIAAIEASPVGCKRRNTPLLSGATPIIRSGVMDFDFLNSLPPELHLHLLRFLGAFERTVLYDINPATLEILKASKDISSRWNFSDCRLMTGKTLNEVTKLFKKRITSLSLDFTPWLAVAPAINRCASLVELDLLETSVRGPMLVKILSETKRLKGLSWTVDEARDMKLGSRVSRGHEGGLEASTGKPDVKNAARNLKNVTRLKLAVRITRVQRALTAMEKNYFFIVNSASENLESLTVIAKDTPTAGVVSTHGLDILADTSAIYEAIHTRRKRLGKNMRDDKSFTKLTELSFVWTGDKLGFSELKFSNYFATIFVPLVGCYNQHQKQVPPIKFRKLVIPSINGRIALYLPHEFPHLRDRCVLDCSELEELTILCLKDHNGEAWYSNGQAGFKLVDLDLAPKLKSMRIFNSCLTLEDVGMGVFQSEALEKLQISTSPGVETRNRGYLPGELVKAISSTLCSCLHLTHLDLSKICHQSCPVVYCSLTGSLKPPACAQLKAVALSSCLAFSPNGSGKTNLQRLATVSPKIEILEVVDHCHEPSISLMPNKNRLSANTQECEVTTALASLQPFDWILGELVTFKELRSLTLASIPAPIKLTFLPDLARSCPRLEHLSLARIGLTGACSFVDSLSAALPKFASLKDLRIDHAGFPVGRLQFLHALRECQTLERLVVFCQHEELTRSSKADFVLTVKSLPHLSVLQLFSQTSVKLCAEITKSLTVIMKARCPGFHLLLSPMFSATQEEKLVRNLKAIPFKHWHEMTSLQSRIFPVL